MKKKISGAEWERELEEAFNRELAEFYQEDLHERIHRRNERMRERKEFEERIEGIVSLAVLILAFIAGLILIIALFPA
jgi:hypothetical protein